MGSGCVACRIIVSAPVPVPFLRTWIWVPDLRLGFGTGLRLDNDNESFSISKCKFSDRGSLVRIEVKKLFLSFPVYHLWV